MCSLTLLKLQVTVPNILLFIAAICSVSIAVCKAVPVDLFNSGYDEIKKSLPPKTQSPGLCPENLNNDNITNIKWYRYYNATKKCYHIDERGPCGQNMIFYRVGETEFGDCDCNFYYKCARPLIYWAPEGRCYFTNEQGPCKENEWLVVAADNLLPTCVPNPCVHNQTMQPSRKDRYWFQHDNMCYMTMTRGYCSHPEEVLYTKWDEHHPSCHIGRECNLRKVRGASTRSAAAASSQQTSSCLPGQKLDGDGKCRNIVRVSWWAMFAK